MTTDARSLRRQLLQWLILLLGPLLILGGIFSYGFSIRYANLAYDRSLFRAALALADQVLVVDGQVEVNLPPKAFDLLEYDKDDWIYFRVTDPLGNTVIGEVRLPPPPRSLAAGAHMYYDADLAGKAVRIAAFALPLNNTQAKGSALIQVAETKAKRDILAEEMITAIMLPQLLLVLLAGLLINYGIRRGLRPLDTLQQAIEQRSHLDLGDIPTGTAPQELQPILQAMNQLLQRVRDGIAHQQRFTADASHQLRTPLAGLQTQAELALREADPEKIHQALLWIQSSSLRLSHLVSQLLALSTAEPGSGQEVQFQSLDLVALGRTTATDFVTMAISRQIDLGFESMTATLPILGNPLTLREMLANLLDNALRYTPRGGRVTLTLSRETDTAVIFVEDNGPGIPPDQRAQVFERFYRMPGNTEEGCGLGLAIVKEVVTAHNGSIDIAEGCDGGGTCFRVCLPLNPAHD